MRSPASEMSAEPLRRHQQLSTKPGQGRCAANGSIALIDPPVSPTRLPVGPAARCRDLSLQEDDQ